MKKLKFIAGVTTAIAVISISAGCGNSTTGTNSATNSNSTTNSVNPTQSQSQSPSPGTSTTQTQPRPDLLTTCPVTGDTLGSMGTPYVLVYQGQEVKFCCASCTNDFFKDPDKYMKMIRAADKSATK